VSARIALVLALVLAPIVSSCSLLPCVERRHASGLLLVCAEPVREVPGSLARASSIAWSLAEEHPNEFGFPWPDPDTGRLELRVTGPQAQPFVDEWIAGNAMRGTGEKAMTLPRPEVPVKLVTVDRSFRQLIDIQNGSVPAKDLPDGELIWMTGPDWMRNAIVIGVDHESDALLRALAAKYGTSAIVIRIEARARTMPL
jgi:hypothetical protein